MNTLCGQLAVLLHHKTGRVKAPLTRHSTRTLRQIHYSLFHLHQPNHPLRLIDYFLEPLHHDAIRISAVGKNVVVDTEVLLLNPNGLVLVFKGANLALFEDSHALGDSFHGFFHLLSSL
mgnify:CR=1 FL=1